MEWTSYSTLLATGIVATGALLQAVTGLGAGLVIVPLLALISIQLVPGPMVLASVALSLSMAVAGRRHIDFANTKLLMLGLLLGTIAAAAYIAHLPLDAMALVFGIFILIAIAITLKTRPFSLTSRSSIAIGALSGFMGTSVGIGAPVLALAFQHYTGERLRATLAYLYTVSSFIILTCLHFAGRFGGEEIVSGLILTPGFLVGYLLSPKLVKLIDRGYARPAVLMLSTVSACLLIWRGLSALRD